MRLIAKIPRGDQVSALVDNLKIMGLDRKDMIISNAGQDETFNTPDDKARETIFIKNERDALGEADSFTSGIEDLDTDNGITVSVDISKHMADRVRLMMIQSGAVHIVQE